MGWALPHGMPVLSGGAKWWRQVVAPSGDAKQRSSGGAKWWRRVEAPSGGAKWRCHAVAPSGASGAVGSVGTKIAGHMWQVAGHPRRVAARSTAEGKYGRAHPRAAAAWCEVSGGKGGGRFGGGVGEGHT